MLDTNLKKSRKLKNLIIALIVILPALLLVCLYPRMEKAMLDKEQQWKQEWEERYQNSESTTEAVAENDSTDNVEVESSVLAEEQTIYYLQDEFVNYAIETSYYQYAMMLQKETSEEVFIDVLDQYGWINDYYEMTGVVPCYGRYQYETEENVEKILETSNALFTLGEESVQNILLENGLSEPLKTQLKAEGLLGYLLIEYDSFGNLSDIRIHGEDSVVYNKELYRNAKNSIEQYQENARFYGQVNEETDSYRHEQRYQVCPKNFHGIYLFYKDSERFVHTEDYQAIAPEMKEPHYAPHDLYFGTGAYVIVAACALFAFLAAMILPFFKKLETGWEKLFSIPVELTLIVAAAGIALGFGMCCLMSITTMTGLENFVVTQGNRMELLGYQFTVAECYNILLVVNFLGWAVTFFLEYICAAQLRQFFCGPMNYIKQRFFVIRLIRWIHRKIKKTVENVLDIDINEKLHKSILKIVIANFLIVALLCCIWFAGSLGALIYSVVLYVMLKKYGSRLQAQYQSILNATGQMAEGNLKISLEEDLGVFTPLGEELEKVQQGFAKAVAEEAKSQNMKSELITNVSHDLKTPLTAIITYVDLLKNPELTEEERQSYIETLDLKSQRLKVLIEDLFEVSKANSGNVQMNFMDVDVVKLMKEVRVELSDKIEESGLAFRWNLPEEKVMLRLDGQRTYRIFENLLNNAMKYSMPLTRVYVDVVNKESEVVVSFKNMSAQELGFDAEHLTERFVRGDGSRNSEGSGLGLAIAKSFTELQNGEFDIHVDGDLFKVTLRFRK